MESFFWSKKRVLITGLDGFKGSWLALVLRVKGANVYGLGIKPPWRPTIFQKYKNEIGPIEYYSVNINDTKKLATSLEKIRPDIVFHLAAQPLVLDSYDDPLETIASNVNGVANLFQCIRGLKNKPKLVINVTSDKVYDNSNMVLSFRENDSLGGGDIYSASKACSEIITRSFRKCFFDDSVVICTARAGNVIGGGDWSANRIIPDIVNSLTKLKKPEIRSPDSVRPWQHVLEPISGYVLLAEKAYMNKKFEGAWNFGPALEIPYTVADVYSEFIKHWPTLKNTSAYKLKKKEFVAKKKEAQYLQVDSTKARTLLKWRSRLSFSESIKYTADWYFLNSQGVNSKKLIEMTLDQINNYYKGT